jgi:hypothetical protein
LGLADDDKVRVVRRGGRPHPEKLVLRVYAFAAFALAVAAAALVVGLHDAALAPVSLGGAVGSVILLAFGAVLLVAAWELVVLSRDPGWRVDEPPRCKPVVLVALLLTTLLGLYVFLSAIRAASAQWPVVLVVGVILIVVALLGLRFFARDARVTLPRLGTIALGLLGTIIGTWQFWYQNEYVPSHTGTAVTLDADLRLDRKGTAYDAVRVTLEYENVGEASVSVIGSAYTLTGSRVVRCGRSATADVVQRVFRGFLADPQRTRFMADVWEEQPATVLAAGRFVGDGKRLDADVPARRQLIFVVPRHRYQLLRFRAQLFAIPSSIKLSERERPQYERFAGDNNLYGYWRVDDDSWLHDLVYGRERWVVTRYELVTRPKAPATSPDLRVSARFPEPTWSEGRPSKAYIDRLFEKPQPSDSSEPFAATELPLADPAEPTRDDYLPPTCRGRRKR